MIRSEGEERPTDVAGIVEGIGIGYRLSVIFRLRAGGRSSAETRRVKKFMHTLHLTLSKAGEVASIEVQAGP
jgi:hypothetical protein